MARTPLMENVQRAVAEIAHEHESARTTRAKLLKLGSPASASPVSLGSVLRLVRQRLHPSSWWAPGSPA